MQLLDADLRRDPYDADAWLSMLTDLSARHADLAAPFFDLCLQYFPTSVRTVGAGRVRGPLRGLQWHACAASLPMQGRLWAMYADLELRLKRYDRVERIFEQCLRSCLYVDVWRIYLNYVREVRRLTMAQFRLRPSLTAALDEIQGTTGPAQVRWEGQQNAEGAVDIVKRAYEFALEHIGMDIASTPIWMDYLAFLKAQPVRRTASLGYSRRRSGRS